MYNFPGISNVDGMRLEATGLNSGLDDLDNRILANGSRVGLANASGVFASASLPTIHDSLSPNVVGVLGKEVRLACYVTGLGKNRTVRLTAGSSMHPFYNSFPHHKSYIIQYDCSKQP